MQERGSVLPFVVVVVGVVGFMMAVLLGLGERAVDAAEAQTAADMAALAAVFEGRSGAEDLAARNGAELVGYRDSGAVVHVVVRVGSAEAEAAATYDDELGSTVGDEPGG